MNSWRKIVEGMGITAPQRMRVLLVSALVFLFGRLGDVLYNYIEGADRGDVTVSASQVDSLRAISEADTVLSKRKSQHKRRKPRSHKATKAQVKRGSNYRDRELEELERIPEEDVSNSSNDTN